MRSAAASILGLRVAYGVVLLLAPARITRRWLGPAVRRGSTQVPLRTLGMLEVGIHAGALHALLASRSIRPWLVASVAGDVTDIAATLLSGDQLPEGAVPATVIVGGGSAALTLALLAAPVSSTAARRRHTD